MVAQWSTLGADWCFCDTDALSRNDRQSRQHDQ
jgi:hypothetical protein